MDEMRQELLNFSCQFAKGLERAGNVKMPKAKRILFSGVGGSTLPADLLSIYLPCLNISVHKDYGVPEWVDSSTLVFVSSYSGNTEEPLSSLAPALKKKAKTIAVANGGKLAEMAEKNGVPLILLPHAVQPRCATCYFFSSFAGVLENSGIVRGKKCELLKLGAWLAEKNPGLEKNGKFLGKKLAHRIPIIYSSTQWWPVVRTCKIKFNENAKTPAFWNVFPELNHNEMVGFTHPRAPFSFVFLKDPSNHPRVKKRMEVMKRLMEAKGLPVHEVEMQGKTILQKMFSTLLLMDWASYYCALETGVDPAPVDMVEEFKKKIG